MPSFSKDDIPKDWRELLGDYFESSAWIELERNIQGVLAEDFASVRPEPQNFFKALALTPVNSVKVVILGQDPYHSPGLAQGCLLYTSPSPRDRTRSRMPSSA